MPLLAVEFPIDLPAGCNVRRGAREAIARTKRQREAALWHLTAASRRTGLAPRLPCTVTLTRFSSRKVDGHDGLPNAFKATVDGIACKGSRTRPVGFMAVDDADERIGWKYAQQVVPRALLPRVPGQCVVRIEIAWEESP